MRGSAEYTLQAALDAGAAYADVRVQEVDTEEVSVRNGVLETADQATSAGVGIRVLVDGAWGFAATSQLEGDDPAAAARLAVDVGRASAKVKRRDVVLAPAEVQSGSYETPYREDPFAVGLSEKVDLLVAASEAMRTDERIMAAAAALGLRRERTVFVSSEGSLLTQTILQTGTGISATAADDRDAQHRSYPGGREAHVRLAARDHRLRRHVAGRSRHRGVGRRGGPPVRDLPHPLRPARRLPDLTRDRSGHRPGPLERDDAGRRLDQLPPDPHDERQPPSRRLQPRGADRLDRRRHLHDDEPVVVDRRHAQELPVRLRDRVGDQGRPARADAEEPHVPGHHHRVLGKLRRHRRAGRMEGLGRAQLRQGPAHADGSRGPRGGARPVPQRRRAGCRVIGAERAPEMAERALAVDAAAEVEVTLYSECGGLTRFADSVIHQHTERSDAQIRVRVVTGKRSASASTNRLDDAAIARTGRRALEMARLSPPDDLFP